MHPNLRIAAGLDAVQTKEDFGHTHPFVCCAFALGALMWAGAGQAPHTLRGRVAYMWPGARVLVMRALWLEVGLGAPCNTLGWNLTITLHRFDLWQAV